MQAFFQRCGAGEILFVYFPAQTSRTTRRDVLFVPPFAEEMNKARRMAALQARALAKAGIGTLLVDLYGTGDSQGDFRDARWEIWRDNLSTAVAWLRQNGSQAISVLALRMGALLALDWARDATVSLERVALWQPVLTGDTLIRQFLGLRVIASRMQSGKNIESAAALRQVSAAGESIEVTGYELAPELVASLEKLDLSKLATAGTPPIHWFELVRSAGSPLLPPSQRVVEQWRLQGIAVTASTVVGQSFWEGQNITAVPPLIDATVDIFRTDRSQ
jgi:exosortase A-associated hydrolase 2